jgi:AraC-like DNA-binding protein
LKFQTTRTLVPANANHRREDERVVRPKVVPVPEFGLAVFESRHAPGFSGSLKDDFSKFLLVIGGKAKWQADSQETLVTSDSLVHIPAGLAHRQQDNVNEPVILYAIHYRSHLLPEFLQKELTNHGLMHWNLSAYAPLLARAVRSDFQEMLFEQGSRRQGWEWVLCSRLVELAVRAVRICHQDQEGRQPVFIKGIESAERVARYAVALQTRFYQHQSLDEAAVESGLSRRQFTDMFRKVTGESWKQYIHKLRLEHARRLLLGTDKTVTAAAFESGFEDLSYFNHAFKKAYSTSPQMLRRQVPNSAVNRHRKAPRTQRANGTSNTRPRLPGQH